MKILKKIDSVQLVLDLIIVFIGVTMAFLFTNYQENKKSEQQTKLILSVMDVGLDRYEELFSGFVSYHEKFNKTFRERLNAGEIQNFESDTYPSPQYPLDVITYLLTNKGYESLSPELYLKLATFSNAIQRLVYVEQKLVDASEKYTHTNLDRSKLSELYRIEQLKWANNYLKYLEIRKSTCQQLQVIISELKTLLKETYPDKIN